MADERIPDYLINSFEFCPTSIFLLNEKAEIKYVNEAGLSLLGSKNENLYNKSFFDFLDEINIKVFKDFLDVSINSSRQQKIKTNIKTGEGNYFEALLIAKLTSGSKLKKTITLSVINLAGLDVGKEVNRRSELRFESMANTAPVMIWIADVDGLFSFVNKVWLDYTGEKLGAQLGMNWLKNVHPEDSDKLLSVYKEAFITREHFSAEFRLKRMNNEYQWMLINGSPRVSEQGIFTGFIGSCININEQIKNEEKIKEINTELIESNRTKDKFFSIISHDLRGPMSALMQLLEILADDYDTMKENERFRLISEAAKSSKGTYRLMENLLEWSRVQSGKIKYEPERMNLLQVIKDVTALYDQNIKNKKINLKVNLQQDIEVFTDKKMIETVVRNLLSNAIKFTQPKGSINIKSEMDEDFVSVKIKDTGLGMDEEDMSKLFRLDVSHSTKGTDNESGTGLGLILCKELVERQGGTIGVKSKLNQGSTFYFTIPLAK